MSVSIIYEGVVMFNGYQISNVRALCPWDRLSFYEFSNVRGICLSNNMPLQSIEVGLYVYV